MLVFFVLNNDPNGLSVLLVYFLSQQQPIRSFLLYQSYNKVLNIDPIYCYYSSTYVFLFSTIKPNRPRFAPVYFCSQQKPTRENILLLNYSKRFCFDQSNCFVRYACIFVFLTVIQTLNHLGLYIVDVP